MRVLNQADHVAKGVCDSRHLDVTPDVLHRLAPLGAPIKQALISLLDVSHTPVHDGVVTDVDTADVRIESQLEPADLESDVDARLVSGADRVDFVLG